MILRSFSLGVPGIFVTGTDTNVGKTIVVGALASAAHQCGVRLGVMKPVESGCPRRDGRLVPHDAIFAREMARSTAPLSLVNPYALEHPLAPALASEIENVTIDIAKIATCYKMLAEEHSPMLVEGAGGLLTPLTGNLTMRDLAVHLRLPVLIVARNTLGVINHVAMTVQCAKAAGLDVIGVVLNRASIGEDQATLTNAGALRRWGGAPLLGELPFLTSLDSNTLAVQGLYLASRIAAVRAQVQGRRAPRQRRFSFTDDRRGVRHG